MPFSFFGATSRLRSPLFWLGVVGLLLLGVLLFWRVRQPTDATGNSLILSQRATRVIQDSLRRQAARRHLDSLRAVGAEAAAAGSYAQGQQSQSSAENLHRRAREVNHDTTANIQMWLNKF